MRRTVTAAVAGVALAGVIGVGIAAAADSTGPAGRFADALAGLVSKGTITQSQADAVAEALTDVQADARAERQADTAQRKADIDALLQKTLGMDSDAVRAKLADGQTLLEIAGDSADELAAGALDLLGQRLDQAVKDGRITQAQAEETMTRAKERADAWLAGKATGRGAGLGLLMGPGGGWGHGHGGRPGHGPAWDDDADGGDGSTLSPSSPAPSATASAASLRA